jgi:hypothetical protein
MLEVLKRCFAVNLNDYENININLQINVVILGTFIAAIFGVVFLHIYRGNIRVTVVQLTRHAATSKESAKTLKELGLNDSRVIKRLLSSHNVLTQVVERAGAVKYDYDSYVKMSKEERTRADEIDFDKARFYIKEEETNRAGFIVERYVTSLPRTLAACTFVAILSGCIIVCMPGILEGINNLLGSINK